MSEQDNYMKSIELYGDGIGRVDYVNHMGTDLTVVNSARVSFGVEKEELDARDKKLINYLIKHRHTSTLEHCTITFRIKVPLYIRSQHHRHRTWSYNEISRRYVDSDPEFYQVDSWRGRAENKKQGSSDEAIEYNLGSTLEFVKTTYQNMLKAGIAPEMARMVLPQNLYTEWFWSGTLMAFARVCNLRCKSDTQWETQLVAGMIDIQAKEKFPASWKALRDD